MISESKRGKDLPWSPIRSLMPFARKAKEDGVKVFHLNIGQPDIITPPEALQRLKNDPEPIIEYGPSEGLVSLRKKVAEYYQTFAPGISFEDIFVTTGASEAIFLALMAICDPGDEIIIPEPFYANYIGFAQMSGVKIRAISSFIDEEFSLPSIQEFEKKINNKTKAILLCNPGNPTGQMYGKEELKELAKLVKSQDLFLIVDEVYREFCYDGEFTSVLDIEEINEQVLVIDSISKVFSACGARVGYLVTRNKDIQQTVLKYAQLRLCPPYFGQRLAEFCYDYFESYVGAAKAEYIKRREVFYEGLRKIHSIKIYKPQAAFYNIVELPVDDGHKFCRWMLEEFRHENSTVMLAPAAGFYQNTDLGMKQVRLAYVLNEQNLKVAIECLEKGLENYPFR